MARFWVRYDVSGTATSRIEAETLEDAEYRIAEEVEGADFHVDLDEIDTVDFTVKEMLAVTRNGHEIWTTNALKDDMRGHASALKETPLFGAP